MTGAATVAGIQGARARHTPDRWRRLLAVLVTTTVVAGGAAALVLAARSGRLEGARIHAAQAVRLQSIATDVAQADAVATTAFLSGALETPGQRARYDAAVARAADSIAAAVAARPASAPALGAINGSLTSYVQTVTSARTFNRLGQPLGSAFLLQATTASREDVLPALAGMVRAEIDAGRSDLDAASLLLWALLATVALGIGVPAVAQYRLARQTHRVLHPPMAGGTLLLALLLAASAWSTVGSAVRAHDVDSGPFAATIDLARLRVATFQARSAEATTLIRRGTGATFEAAYRTSVAEARRLIGRPGLLRDGDHGVALLTTWAREHAAVRALDDGGDWEGAVSAATGEKVPLATAFEAFASWSQDGLDREAADTATGLEGARPPAVLAVLVLLGGLAAAAGTLASMLQRLAEYR